MMPNKIEEVKTLVNDFGYTLCGLLSGFYGTGSVIFLDQNTVNDLYRLYPVECRTNGYFKLS